MEIKQAQHLQTHEDIISHYARVRHDSELLCEPLEIEDYGIQTMPEVSPPKWHLAHTSWFFETLLLKPHLKEYKEHHPQYAVLFNSYYDTIGSYHPRNQRGLLSRPTVGEVYQYRAYVDDAMSRLLSDTEHPQHAKIVSLTVLGLNHEQQHQELLLTDIKHILASNPLRPVYKHQAIKQPSETIEQKPVNWIEFNGGIKTIGYTGKGFSYDNEGPPHKVYMENFQLASKPVSNREYLAFINDGGYSEASYWLSDAWVLVRQQQWQAPLYWEQIDKRWFNMTLAGMKEIVLDAPVCHVSYFEAAAYVRWASKAQPGIRLPSEVEWEIAASDLSIEGNLRDLSVLQPRSVSHDAGATYPQQMFGDVWEWTQSPYTAYPGYHAARGPLGEYNGKFMSSQMVLRGGSCATPADHIRASYRNFFYPHERWQFSGFRLAKDSI